jgi:Fur family zinc uptake transcriptional regulator
MTETLRANVHDHNHDQTHSNDLGPMTRNQKLVLEALSKSKAPQSAYGLLDLLRPQGFKAPLQVYRALDKLVERGQAHKLESLSAYVACQHPSGEGQAATVFMICGKCGKVSERTDQCILGDIKELANKDGFTVAQTSIEIQGRCGSC